MPNTLSMRNSTGQKIRDIANNAAIKEAFRTLKVSQKEFFSFKTRENIALNGWMIKPVNFDPTKKYPVLMVQYSGPGSQMVLDEWDFGWEYYLSTLNYVVVCVDGRGTGARGSEFMKCTYKQMGVLETRDQVETAKYLGDLSYIDKNRIGIWGWSFGGTMTLTAMSTGEKVFKAGISVAPVTDWRFYNTAYTERFMQTPQENFSGYDQSSALLNAGKLNGRLLIIHGTSDDNVHYTNTLVYINKLVELEKQFEMQIYTDKNHSITGKQTRRHLYTRMVEFLERNL
ncbi:Prolyl tripeptidyl peptidase [bioreactor metagenome]|uniref:Prolyl tripeptidyl peptidase n=1 Tax=bioreactor metagenome TaxID=1076179 RepID=A0A645EB99_9ZZZZ